MKVQFLYHPENDKYIASKIIKAVALRQSFSLKDMSVKDIKTPSNELFDAIKNCDVLILLIGTTFNKIAPFVWMSAIQHRRPIVGIDIHSILDEWGETRKKSCKLQTEATMENGRSVQLFETYVPPESENGISYIIDNIHKWCDQAINYVESNYGIN